MIKDRILMKSWRFTNLGRWLNCDTMYLCSALHHHFYSNNASVHEIKSESHFSDVFKHSWTIDDWRMSLNRQHLNKLNLQTLWNNLCSWCRILDVCLFLWYNLSIFKHFIKYSRTCQTLKTHFQGFQAPLTNPGHWFYIDTNLKLLNWNCNVDLMKSWYCTFTIWPNISEVF